MATSGTQSGNRLIRTHYFVNKAPVYFFVMLSEAKHRAADALRCFTSFSMTWFSSIQCMQSNFVGRVLMLTGGGLLVGRIEYFLHELVTVVGMLLHAARERVVGPQKCTAR
jgi:hypothetical protein